MMLRHGQHNPRAEPIEPLPRQPRSNGKPSVHEYVVTVQVEQFVTVQATSPDKAAAKVRRDMRARTGRGTIIITDVSQVP